MKSEGPVSGVMPKAALERSAGGGSAVHPGGSGAAPCILKQ
ncbi:MAG: hypothetical protein Q8K36_01515 [Alphaproteobacteria bacterium]|nr:hypothetical protein [Alphaproteobacteria bacterium]